MTAPGPVDGTNPYTGTYQTKQYDTSWPPAEVAPAALATTPGAPAAGSFVGSNVVTSSASPAKVFAANAWQLAHPGWTGIP